MTYIYIHIYIFPFIYIYQWARNGGFPTYLFFKVDSHNRGTSPIPRSRTRHVTWNHYQKQWPPQRREARNASPRVELKNLPIQRGRWSSSNHHFSRIKLFSFFGGYIDDLKTYPSKREDDCFRWMILGWFFKNIVWWKWLAWKYEKFPNKWFY